MQFRLLVLQFVKYILHGQIWLTLTMYQFTRNNE